MQPAEVVGHVEIPGHIRFWGIDSGIRHRYAKWNLPMLFFSQCEDWNIEDGN